MEKKNAYYYLGLGVGTLLGASLVLATSNEKSKMENNFSRKMKEISDKMMQKTYDNAVKDAEEKYETRPYPPTDNMDVADIVEAMDEMNKDK